MVLCFFIFSPMSITTITAANTAPVRSGDLCNKRIGATGKPVFYIPELGSEAVEHFVLNERTNE